MTDDPLTPYGNRPMVTPIVNAVNYEYSSFEVLRQITDGEIDGYTYHRDDNPTVRAVEEKIAAMEKSDDCIVCTTGMAACTMVYMTYLSAGDNVIIFHDVYGAHYKVSLILERMGVDVTWVDADEHGKIGEYFTPKTKMVFCETPSNPLCKVVDVSAVAEAAHKVGAMVVVDNTSATPHNQRPLSLGADLVVHSATKGLGGHNDLMAGGRSRDPRIAMTICGSLAKPLALRWMPIPLRSWSEASRVWSCAPSGWPPTPWPWPNYSPGSQRFPTSDTPAWRAIPGTR